MSEPHGALSGAGSSRDGRHGTSPQAGLIEVRDLTKVYDGGSGVAALTELNLSFDSGEFASIAGPSGSGKSTLLNIVGGLDRPSSGEVLFEGKSLGPLTDEGLAEFRLRNLGFVFQAYNLIPVLSAAENVEYPLVLQGLAHVSRRKKALKTLELVGLEGLGDRRPNQLSGGQQQRVAVARAIVHRPRVVLADEPTANLDSRTAAALLDLMEGLNRELGVTFIFSSHDPAVLTRASRVVRLKDGRLAPDIPGGD